MGAYMMFVLFQSSTISSGMFITAMVRSSASFLSAVALLRSPVQKRCAPGRATARKRAGCVEKRSSRSVISPLSFLEA